MARHFGTIVLFLFCGVLILGGVHCSRPTVYVCFEATDCPKDQKYTCVNGECKLSSGSSDTEKTAGDGGTSDTNATDGSTETCLELQSRSCYTGPAGTLNKGACRQGDQTCLDGKWGACLNQVLPQNEICDGRDNNCNGQVDETCQCKPGEAQGCYTGPPSTQGQGACKAGTRVCQANKIWGPCQDQIVPSEEQCDNIDNDCNGEVDEGCTKCTTGEKRECYTGPPGTKGVGVCLKGVQQCGGLRQWSICFNQLVPSFEYCDGKDNDCNGVIDDNCKECEPGTWRECYPTLPGVPANLQPCVAQGGKWVCKGACYTGRQNCSAGGKYLDCVGMLLPRAEDCNGKDDDCDGQVDEQLSPPLCNTAAKGACIGAVKKCDSTRGWLPCTLDDYARQNRDYEKLETRCDGKDNDCNGQIDENCQNICTPGQSRKCFDGLDAQKNKGICKEGIQTCSGSKQWGPCVNQVLPKAETCNKIDDDCDGFIDESYPQQGQACNTGKPGLCSTGFYACTNGVITCPQSFQPRVEICNGKDDNCNGQIDEGAAQYTFYRDADGDGFGDPKQTIKACVAPIGYVTNNKDCYDNNRFVYPGQFAFFSNNRGDGSFDYNCDGVQQKRFTTPGSCRNCQSAVIDIGFLDPNPACGQSGKWVDKCRFDVGACYPITIPKNQECR